MANSSEGSLECKVDRAKKSLDKLNWPKFVHSTEFRCDKKSIQIVARQLGYFPRPCPTTPDGVWRTKKGEVKIHIMYEKQT